MRSDVLQYRCAIFFNIGRPTQLMFLILMRKGGQFCNRVRPSVVGEEFCFDYCLGRSVDDSPQKTKEEVAEVAAAVPPPLDSPEDSGWSSEDSAMENVD